jgi:tryptophanyl-tRNA synthetase
MSLSDPTKKMSKSDDDPNGCVLLMDEVDTVVRKFKRAVTDSGTEIRFDESRPAITNLLEIYHLITGKSVAEIEDHFAGKGYAQLKGDLADATLGFLAPIQQRVREITDERLDAILEQGREKASRIARATLREVFERTGLRGSLKR